MSLLRRKFAASLWIWASDFAGNKYKTHLERASEFGFDGVEIPTFDGMIDTAQVKEALGKSSHQRSLTPIIIGGGSIATDISSANIRTNQNGIQYVKRCIDVCRELGGSLVCGPFYSAVGNLLNLSASERDEALERVALSFMEIGRFAQQRGVRIALEPLCRYDTHLINTAADGVKLVEMIGEKNVGLLLDTFHLNIEEKSIAAAIEIAGKRLFHFHACENDRGTPGSGHIEWEEIAKSLNKIEYEGWIAIESFAPYERDFSSAMRVWRSIEHSQDDIAVKGLAFLKSKLG